MGSEGQQDIEMSILTALLKGELSMQGVRRCGEDEKGMEGKGDLSDPEREDKSIGSFSPKGQLSSDGKNLGEKPFRSFKETLPS